MSVPGQIKPTHKAIGAYFEALRAYHDQQVTHEGVGQVVRVSVETVRIIKNLPAFEPRGK